MEAWYDEIIEKCPNVFRHIKYVECCSGWKDLIFETAIAVENELVKLPPHIVEEMYATQIKEKFGGLRFYMSYCHEVIDDIISRAESKSTSICEVCGSPGSRKIDRGWIQTLCNSHGNKNDEREE